MTIRNLFLASATMPSFISNLTIEGEGNDSAGGGGSSSSSDQSAGNAPEPAKLTAAEEMEKEFLDPESQTDDDGSDDTSTGEGSDGDEGDDEPGGNLEDEGSDDNADDGDEGEAGEAAPAPKKNRAQERIDELTAQSRQHERDAEKWRAEAIKRGATDDSDGPVVPEEPDPEKYPYGEHDAEYIRERAKYDTRMEIIQEQAESSFKAQAAELDAKWTKNQAEALTRYPDFDEVVVKGSDKWACPPVIAVGIKDSDVGPDVAYELAKNPDEALRISKLTPLEQAREFGLKEAGVRHKKEVSDLQAKIDKLEGKGDRKPNLITKAPEPPRRQVRGSGGNQPVAADTNDFAAFDKMADAMIEKKRAAYR